MSKKKTRSVAELPFFLLLILFPFTVLYYAFKLIVYIFDNKVLRATLGSFIVISTFSALILYASDRPGLFADKSTGDRYKVIFAVVSVTYFALYLTILSSDNKHKHTIAKLDEMDGHSFENACADILKANGFKNVRVTKGSGDFGIDILAEKEGRKYGVQCKRYEHRLDNKPIQEVVGGLAYYGCTNAAVMTNSDFTQPARRLAEVNNVELWDRDVLYNMLAKKRVRTERSSAPAANNEITEHDAAVKLNALNEYRRDIPCILKDLTEKLTLYFQSDGIDAEIVNIDIIYEENAALFEIKPKLGISVKELKKYTRQISDRNGMGDVEFVFPSATPGTVGFKIPLPDNYRTASLTVGQDN